MVRQQKDTLATLIYITDILLVLCITIIGRGEYGVESALAACGVAVAWAATCAALRNADPRRQVSLAGEVWKTAVCALVATGAARLLAGEEFNLKIFFPAAFIAVIAYRRAARLLFNALRNRGYNKTSMIVVGWSDKTAGFFSSLQEAHMWDIDVHGVFCREDQEAQLPAGVKRLGTLSDIDGFLNEARQIDMAISTCDVGNCPDIVEALKKCANTGHEIIYYAEAPADCGIAERKCSLYGNKVYVSNVPACCSSILKVVMDFLSSVTILVFAMPVIAVISLIIKISEPGAPVFFLQKRMGRHGRMFKIYKFRTMYKNAEEMKAKLIERSIAEAPLFKLPDDPRITPVGRTLRRFGLDELPQLFNVIKGDMSMVGPRPHDAAEAKNYEVTHRIRLIARPGITGLGQVSGGSVLPFKQQVDLDIRYFKEWNPFWDVKIILQTIPFIIKQGTVK